MISRKHASIYEVSGEWWIRDEGSLNGIIINGTRVAKNKAAALAVGDTGRCSRPLIPHIFLPVCFTSPSSLMQCVLESGPLMAPPS